MQTTKSTKLKSVSTRRAAYPTVRHNPKTIYEQETSSFLGSPSSGCIFGLCTRQRHGGHYRSHQHGDELFRSGNEVDLRLRGGHRSDRRRQGLWQILVGRSRHVENRRELVRSVHFPDRRRDHLTLVLPVKPHIMAEFPINKGIGRSVEFKGLKAQYLFIFCGGLLVVFVLFIILYMVGIDQWFCIGFGVISASVLVWQTFALNARYGEHGLMKLGAVRSHPRYLINRRRIARLFTRKKEKNEKHT